MKTLLIIISLLLTVFSEAQTNGVILGNSTSAAYPAGECQTVASYVLTTPEITAGYTITSLAVAGNTINQQKSAWDGYANKTATDYIIVEIGLNDVGISQSTATVLARYQALIDDINATKKTGAKVIVSTMTPAHQRWVNVYGVNAPTAQQQWYDMNEAVKGNGANAITGVDARVSSHTTALADGSWNLLSQYETSLADGIHENNTARQIIASAWRSTLVSLNQLPNTNTTILIKRGRKLQ